MEASIYVFQTIRNTSFAVAAWKSLKGNLFTCTEEKHSKSNILATLNAGMIIDTQLYTYVDVYMYTYKHTHRFSYVEAYYQPEENANK